jgi:nucleotide-binding universal stress UspA family protein
MELRDILVNMDVDNYASSLIEAAVDLADRFGARVSGLAAAGAPTGLIAAEGTAVTVGAYEAERAAIERRLASLEAEFREAVPARCRDTCLTVLDNPNKMLTTIARRADLVLLQSPPDKQEASSRHVEIGSLLLALGRPVLLFAADARAVKAETIVLGWKDTREARRAAADAMPLLKVAKDVIVATIDEGERIEQKASVEDVAAWLQRHEVKARGDVYPAVGTPGETLVGIARRAGSDLIVSGAYGHSRLREWMFGGVTRDLLDDRGINRFMSN